MNRPKTRILMVCLGNICRSPLAEGILRSMTDPGSVDIDSAGTAGYHVGSPPDGRSIEVARKYGIDISRQRCRKFQEQDLERFDIIYAMDRANFNHIKGMTTSREQRAKVKLLLEETSTETKEVPDPYYGGEEGFEEVYNLLTAACEALSRRLELKFKNK